MRALIIALFTIFGTQAIANEHRSIFEGKIKKKPSYNECSKAIEKGVLVSIVDEGTRSIFYYKGNLYTINASPIRFVCIVAEKLMKR